MRLSLGLVSAAALMVAGGSAIAADYVGPYASAFGGYVYQPSYSVKLDGPNVRETGHNGVLGGGAVGYDFGLFRVEGEASYRSVKGGGKYDGHSVSGGKSSSLGLMINAYYDFTLDLPVTPYVGAGVGAGWTRAAIRGDSDTDWNFAYQGIAGVKYDIFDQLSVFLDYRYFATLDPTYHLRGNKGDAKYKTHNIVAGLTFNFGATPEPAPEPAPPAPAPAPSTELSRSYLVFFDWDSVKITPEAQAIIQDAYNAATSLGVARIQLTGHADRSGSAAYNQRLSVRRAVAVKKVLTGLGFPAAGVTTIGKGESDPLVPTPDGVREPQNRRVEIVLE